MFFVFVSSHLIHLMDDLGQPASKEDKEVNSADLDIGDEANKVAVIVEADTAIDPRTMMIHLQDTSTTSTAMMGAGWFVIVACFTETRLVC